MRVKNLIIFLCILSIAVQIFFRYRLTVARYFDVDEFAHLHWAYNLTTGDMPYRDFFYIFPPYFLFQVGAVVGLSGREAPTLINVRILMFIVQLFSYLALFLWAKKLRNIVVGFLSLVIFLFLPLPSDKLLEIRPDLTASVLAFFGLYGYILALENKKSIYYFLSGFLLSASFGFVPKTVFFLFPVFILALYRFFTLKKNRTFEFLRDYLFFFLGALINAAIVILFFVKSGNFLQALYFVTKLASDVTSVLGAKFYMRPDIFFYPNDVFYGTSGINPILIANLAVYLTGLVWGIKSFVSALSADDHKRGIAEFVFACALFANLFAFVKIFPLKHLQYLIPVSFFVAFYFADFIAGISGKLKNKALSITVLAFFAVAVSFLSYRMFMYKINWVNTATINNLSKILAMVPEGTPIFDLTGETIFYPDGYYFCCLPYGQYEENLTFPYPELEADLKERNTKFVFAGDKGRLDVLPAVHKKYIEENFKDSPIPGLLERK